MSRARKISKKKLKLTIKITALLAVIIFIFLSIDRHIRPTVRQTAVYKSKFIASEIINKSISDAIEMCGFTYEDLVIVNKNSDNNITSIQANTINITKMQETVVKNVITGLKAINGTDIKIPMGTLLGSQLLSGRGPKINMKFMLGDYVSSSVKSEFKSAGINQTLHTITVNTGIKLTTILPGYSVDSELNNNFTVAETVIVGNIPNSFSNIITQSLDSMNIPEMLE